MSVPVERFPSRAALRKDYGKQRRSQVADAAGQAVLDFGFPPQGFAWVIYREFVRGAAGMTVRLFIGGTSGTVTDLDEEDAVITTAAAPIASSAGDEYYAEHSEPVWMLVTGAGAGTQVVGKIRYRVLAEVV